MALIRQKQCTLFRRNATYFHLNKNMPNMLPNVTLFLCANTIYDQCGGKNFLGQICCSEGLCSQVNQTFSQCLPSTSALPKSLGSGYWSTKGSELIDSQGSVVKLAGVNWFGGETNTLTPHGLWSLNYKVLIRL